MSAAAFMAAAGRSPSVLGAAPTWSGKALRKGYRMTRGLLVSFIVLVFVTVNVCVLLKVSSRREDPWAAQRERQRAEVTGRLGREIRFEAVYGRAARAYDYFCAIGGLAEGRAW